MRVAIGCEHAGFELKQVLIKFLKEKGHEIADFGTNSSEPIDYPPICFRLGEAVVNQEADLGILICGTGIGVSIAANKVKGVRAALCRSSYEAKLSRLHNNANVLCLGAWITGTKYAQDIVQNWLITSFEGDRHNQRLDLIADYEKN